MALKVIALEAAHNVKDFNCGNEILNTWLRQMANQHVKKMISKTYVLIDDTLPDKILGFYSVAIRAMTSVTELPVAMQRRLPKDVPGYTLGRLAVSEEIKGSGRGEYLLIHAIERVCQVAENIGGSFLFVDAKDSAAASFYSKYGFIPTPSDPLTLVMSLAELPVQK